MRTDRGRAALVRAGLIAALLLLQAGCMGLGSARREREGKAALDQVRLKDGDTEQSAIPRAADPPKSDDLLRRYEAETKPEAEPAAPKPRKMTKAERDQQDAADAFRESMRKQRED